MFPFIRKSKYRPDRLLLVRSSSARSDRPTMVDGKVPEIELWESSSRVKLPTPAIDVGNASDRRFRKRSRSLCNKTTELRVERERANMKGQTKTQVVQHTHRRLGRPVKLDGKLPLKLLKESES